MTVQSQSMAVNDGSVLGSVVYTAVRVTRTIRDSGPKLQSYFINSVYEKSILAVWAFAKAKAQG